MLTKNPVKKWLFQIDFTGAEFQHPCRDRNDSHTLIQCTVDSIYWSACVVIYIFHICTCNHAYSDRLQT